MLPWVLFIVLLSPVPGFESLTKLNDFATYEECKVERDRIGFEMAEAYPYDRDFVVECREWKPRRIKVSDEAPKTVPEEVVPPAITKADYDVIIINFSKLRYPKEKLSIRVVDFKPLQNEAGPLPVFAVQIHVTHKDGVHSYILIIKNKVLLGWIDAGEVDPQEEETEEETFSAKDQA